MELDPILLAEIFARPDKYMQLSLDQCECGHGDGDHESEINITELEISIEINACNNCVCKKFASKKTKEFLECLDSGDMPRLPPYDVTKLINQGLVTTERRMHKNHMTTFYKAVKLY